MARKTQRISHHPLRGDPRVGAAEAAPTAPHATQAPERDRSGPAKFWASHRVKLVMTLTFIFSAGLHSFLTPWELPHSGIQGKDNDDELTVPIDLFGEEQPAPPPPKQEDIQPTNQDPDGPGRDGGVYRDAAIADASRLGPDGGLEMTTRDGGDADGDAGADAGNLASTDGGPPSNPGDMIGAPVNVALLVNVAVIRGNPVGAQVGPLVNAIPQWASFMKGSQNQIDPIRDTDWIYICGPSLIHTDRDAVVVHYSVPDAIVDTAVENVAAQYDKGGALDAGVPGVRAWKGHADNAERAFLRPSTQPGVLVIVPPTKANEFAKVLKQRAIAPKIGPTEAIRLTVKNPSKQISIPAMKFPESMKEIRLWIVPRAADGGADIYAEADCTDEAAAADVESTFKGMLTQYTTGGTGFVVNASTGGILKNATITVDGKRVKLHIDADQTQLQRTLDTIKPLIVKTQAGAP